MQRIYLDPKKKTFACSNGGVVQLCYGCTTTECLFVDITPDKVIELKGGKNEQTNRL